MNLKLLAAVAIVLLFAAPSSAHKLDEYLQATLISVEKDHIQASIRLIPGVGVSPAVLASIDTDGDGVLSDAEQRAYVQRVLRDLSLTVDGESVSPTLVSQKFPATGEIIEGFGEIQIEFTVDLPKGTQERSIVFENHHQNNISVYLVNCLVPRDPTIRILTQSRNQSQSFYRLDYAQADRSSSPASMQVWSTIRGRIGEVGFASIFQLGMRHIAEGTDHLFFLLALLLPAPLLALGSRWAGFAGMRHSVLQILRVVTAFTIGHSITLALAALGLVRVPSRPIEVLIALSIFVSAAHAIRPLFPGREAGIAAFFGLIHGLAFAATLGELGLGRWERVASILGFNLGIETMQLIVVAATMPSLVLLSRTRAYSVVRIGGALFAGLASMGWIAERSLHVHNPVDAVAGSVVHYAVWTAGVLFIISLVSWSLENVLVKRPRAAGIDIRPTLKHI